MGQCNSFSPFFWVVFSPFFGSNLIITPFSQSISESQFPVSFAQAERRQFKPEYVTKKCPSRQVPFSFLLWLFCHCCHLNGGGVFVRRWGTLDSTGWHRHNGAPTGSHLGYVLYGGAQSWEGEQLERAHHFHHSAAILYGGRAEDCEVGSVGMDLNCVGETRA